MSYFNSEEVQVALGLPKNFSIISGGQSQLSGVDGRGLRCSRKFRRLGKGYFYKGSGKRIRCRSSSGALLWVWVSGHLNWQKRRRLYVILLITGWSRCNWMGGEATSMATEYVNATVFRSSLYQNLTFGLEAFGQVRQAGKFSFVRVYNAGHEVPYYQPALSQEVWHRAIFGKDIATGLDDTTPETGTTVNGTFESLPTSGMDPGPFLSWDGTRVVTAEPPGVPTSDPTPDLNSTTSAIRYVGKDNWSSVARNLEETLRRLSLVCPIQLYFTKVFEHAE